MSFFDISTFFLFAEESDEVPVGWSCSCLRVDAAR